MLQRIEILSQKYDMLYGAYQRILFVSEEQITQGPKPTAIFLGVPQYKKIFVGIYQWLNYGVYNYSDQKFLLSFTKISSLYEIYFVFKLIRYYQSRNYELEKSYVFSYPVKEKSEYVNTKYSNSFVLRNGSQKVTLYYQPVVFSKKARIGANKIELYKNNTLPIDRSKKNSAEYYNPDFILKLENNERTNYIVIDAKFSSLDTVKRYYIKDLVFKYLFSLSPTDVNINLLGLCTVYAKCNTDDGIINIYNKQLIGSTIKPYVDALPLIENNDTEKQFSLLDKLFVKYTNFETKD